MTIKVNNIYNAAIDIRTHLHTIDIVDGSTRVVWTDDTSKATRQWFSDVTGEYTDHNMSALDECYIVLQTLCDIICVLSLMSMLKDKYDDNYDEHYRESILENEWAYYGNADLLDWVKDDLSRGDAVNQAMEIDGVRELFPAIQSAMSTICEGMALSFFEAIIKRAKAQ